ncbi:hypothetical protein Tco_0294957 [Tanacetum coccineum]
MVNNLMTYARKNDDTKSFVVVRFVLYDVLKRAGISSRKEALVNFLTDPLERRSTLADILVFGWAGGKHACVDLTGVSPLVGLMDNESVAGQAALKAESSKVAKHEKAYLENQHVFIPFAFDTFGFLAPEADEFLNRQYRISLYEMVITISHIVNYLPLEIPGAMHGYASRIMISSGVIDIFSKVLNHAELYCDSMSDGRVFCDTSMMHEWDVKGASEKEHDVKDSADKFNHNLKVIKVRTNHNLLKKAWLHIKMAKHDGGSDDNYYLTGGQADVVSDLVIQRIVAEIQAEHRKTVGNDGDVWKKEGRKRSKYYIVAEKQCGDDVLGKKADRKRKLGLNNKKE